MWILSRNLCILLFAWSLPGFTQINLHAPTSPVAAGSSFDIKTGGQGTATFYLLGPSHVVKRSIRLGQEVAISSDDVASSGSYQAVACDGQACASTVLEIAPSAPARLSFLLHPSRVPVSASNAINATTLVFDRFDNTVVKPVRVDFRMSLVGASWSTRSAETVRGVTWFKIASSPKQGPLQIVAAVGDITEPRVIQQVASDACGLRVTATPAGRYVKLQTDPIRDCAGNPLPDGTIVSFTKTDAGGRSTVDTPIKKDKASAQFEVSGDARISVACGVVLGNELSLTGRP